jgi:hypothetical protein
MKGRLDIVFLLVDQGTNKEARDKVHIPCFCVLVIEKIIAELRNISQLCVFLGPSYTQIVVSSFKNRHRLVAYARHFQKFVFLIKSCPMYYLQNGYTSLWVAVT